VIISESSESFDRVAEVIKAGGIIAFRTDTLYGLGADPFNPSAVQKIKQLKGREGHKPILVVISERAHVARLLTRQTNSFEHLSRKFWPGALTIIGEAAADLPGELTAGTKTLGVRLPDDGRVRALVEACGGALTATSANPANELPARSALDVEQYFGDAVDLIVDGGAAKTDQPSTVVDATTEQVMLIREGAVPWAQIETGLRSS